MSETTGIQEACDKMGGQKFLAAALGVTQQGVSDWVKRGCAPSYRIQAIVELTGVDPKRLADPSLLQALGESVTE